MNRSRGSDNRLHEDVSAGGGSDKEDNPLSGGNSGGRREFYRYLGLSGQVAASVGVSLFLGIKADKWLKVSFPILSWVLPLLVIVYLIVKLIKESSGGGNGK